MVHDVGPARRVENLAGARRAREIDATGRVVMPAFVDADMALLAPAASETQDGECRAPLRLMSIRGAQGKAARTAAEWARYGCITVGAHTAHATDPLNSGKVLRVHRALQLRPLRIRSIFSPCRENEALTTKWLPAIMRKKLAAVLELRTDEFHGPALRDIATLAEGLGFVIRLRSTDRPAPEELQFALDAGAIAIVGPNDATPEYHAALASVGCVRVVPAAEAFDNSADAARDMRKAIDSGAAIALASSYRPNGASSCNMQFLLHLAVHRLGLTPEEAITATTWNAACSLRLSHVTGSLEPGKPADLLVMNVPDYRDLPRRAGHHDAGLVMRAGHILYRAAPLIPD